MRGILAGIFLLSLILGTDPEDTAFLEEAAFLEENAKNPDVHVLLSGLQYKIISSAENRKEAARPGLRTPCVCHYTGKLLNGDVFDSSRDRGSPSTFTPNKVIAGWTEALQMMREGDRWELYIPSDLAYGERGSPGKIPPNSVLIFDLELIKVKTAKKKGIFSKVGLGVLHTELWGPVQIHHVIIILLIIYYKLIKPGGEETVKASHILVTDRKLCQRLKDELSEVPKEELLATFAKLAREHSRCSSSKVGGDLGEFSRGKMVAAFDEVCWDRSHPVMEVQGPVKTPFGHHLILITKRSDPTDIDEINDLLKKKIQ